MIDTLCKHCNRKKKLHSRGLCGRCGSYLPIRNMYPILPREEELYIPPERKEGDAEKKCFWCDTWNVNEIFQVCDICEIDYQARLKTCPET